MVPDKHRHLHRNQAITNTYNNHQINDKNYNKKNTLSVHDIVEFA